MKNVLFLSLFIKVLFAHAQAINIASLNQGSWMIATPPSYKEVTERNLFLAYSPGALFDETNAVWCSKDTRFPINFVIELAETSEITKLQFDNKCENYSGIETKEVEVFFSTSDANGGFVSAGKYSLKKGTINTFEIEKQPARWIKISVLSNYGNNQWVELAEFEAWGTPLKSIQETIQIDGTWHTNWQDITFYQDGNTFTGHYAYDNVKGTVTKGKITRNVIEFVWKENKLVGTATLYLNEEGNRLSGLWLNSNMSTDYGLWTMERKKPKPIKYENSTVVEEEVTSGGDDNEFEFDGEKVKVGEEIVLNNVLFVRSKAELLPDSYGELDKLVQLLKDNTTLKVDLSGHTDNTGDPKLNVKLSDMRVTTVKNYLIDKGIDGTRITGKGYGPHKPRTKNRTELERKLNRRVEFTLVK